MQAIPASYANILRYATLTGLRPSEACYSIQHLRTSGKKYYNPKTGMLEHFNFPETFIRRTKKAYISIVTPEILKRADKAQTCEYAGLRTFIKRKGIAMNMKYCRRIFTTYLRQQGIGNEMIDLLQGRVPKNVFL